MRKSLILAASMLALVSHDAKAQAFSDTVMNTLTNAAQRESCEVVGDTVVCDTATEGTELDAQAAAELIGGTAFAIARRRGLNWIFLALEVCDEFGCFNGSQPQGDWGQGPQVFNCDNWEWGRDDGGRLIVPAIPLVGGTAFTRYTGNYQVFHHSAGGNYIYSQGSAGQSSVLRRLHLYNIDSGSTQAHWRAVWGIEPRAATEQYLFHYGRPQNDALGIDYRATSLATAGYSNYTMESCPEDQASGGDFHFYNQGPGSYGNNVCTAYAPNYSLSPTGYAYSTVTVLPPGYDTQSYMNNFAPDWLKACDATPSIPDLLNVILQEVAAETDNDVPTVEDADTEIPTDGPPTIGDLTETIPETGYTPPPGEPANPDDGGGDGGGDDDCGLWFWCDLTWGDAPADGGGSFDATVPDLEFPDWFELPEFSFGSPSCPTYSFDAFEETHIVDAHCPFFEDNRALISSLMLIVFTIGSAFIVLRS